MIEYRNVWKAFGDNQVLKGIDLDVRDGETFFVLGKTGAGKTVMIRTLVGLLAADRGSIKIDGEEVTGLTEDEFQSVRLKCGMVFQLPTLFDSSTIFDNVAFGLRRSGTYTEEEIAERVERELQRVELDPAAVMDRMPEELSFGEQKRVGLARTTVLEPDYLLYDEPTTGLDPFTAGRIDRLIKHVNRELGVTAIVVSHDLESMTRIADRVGLLWDGEFCFVGSVEEFLKSDDPRVVEFKKGLVTEAAAK
jgi:phospholipid/cholesterol/gamma-HCH transport system ATP-binding protein